MVEIDMTDEVIAACHEAFGEASLYDPNKFEGHPDRVYLAVYRVLRGLDPNRLPMEEIPEEWEFASLTFKDTGEDWVCVLYEKKNGLLVGEVTGTLSAGVDGYGPDPRSALLEACKAAAELG